MTAQKNGGRFVYNKRYTVGIARHRSSIFRCLHRWLTTSEVPYLLRSSSTIHPHKDALDDRRR